MSDFISSYRPFSLVSRISRFVLLLESVAEECNGGDGSEGLDAVRGRVGIDSHPIMHENIMTRLERLETTGACTLQTVHLK